MAKLISLEGAIVSFSSAIMYNEFKNKTFNVQFRLSDYIDYGLCIGFRIMNDGTINIIINPMTGTYVYNDPIEGIWIYNNLDSVNVSLGSFLSIEFVSGNDLTNLELIDLVVRYSSSIEGGIYEEEPTVQIINPQMYILPPTKVVGNDLVVSAEEVVVNEAKTSFNVVVNLETDPVGTQHYTYYLHINGEYVNNINASGSPTAPPYFSGSSTSKSFDDVTTIGVNLALTTDSNSVKYKIDDGEQQTSSDPITITKDCTITFYIPWGD